MTSNSYLSSVTFVLINNINFTAAYDFNTLVIQVVFMSACHGLFSCIWTHCVHACMCDAGGCHYPDTNTRAGLSDQWSGHPFPETLLTV